MQVHCPKGYRSGTHRACPPEETLGRLKPRLADFGITRVANVTGLDRIGIPVVMVVRPNAMSLAVSQGKGADLVSAQVSGIMESIEAWHAENMTIATLLAPYHDIRARAVDVSRLPQPDNTRFTPDLPILWVEAVDWASGARRLVPHEMVHTRYMRPAPPGSGSFLMSSNGLASGNHLAEAVLHGLCETVERDATALWDATSYEGRAAMRVALDTVDDDLCRWLLERYQAAGIRTALWNATTDVGLPCFICLIVEDEASPAWKVAPEGWGMGCHPSRAVALSRALTEAAQTRLTTIAGTRDDLHRANYVRFLTQAREQDLQSLERDEAGQDFQAVPTWDTGDIGEDVARACAQLGQAGCGDVLVVDLSRKDIGLAVARVLVPGLEGPSSSPRYQRGPRARR
ncbi:MAG TPA: YcaO-like family protein [Candidatus Xenobia bacterium]|jgi:ribosomal protein S12 methylthiotransferase accessory factor